MGLGKNSIMGFPGASNSKESACNVKDLVQSLGQEDALEKGTTTHSSILAWRIPWTKESGRLQSVESQKVEPTEQLLKKYSIC